MADVGAILDALAPRLREALARRGARLELDVRASVEVEEHLAGPLATMLLALARWPGRAGVVRIRAIARAGGDGELCVDGLDLPPRFPHDAPESDLWALAAAMLREHHRARLGHAEDRMLLLVPARSRARALRGAAKG